MKPANERLEQVLSDTFRGINHCGPIRKHYEGGEFEMWETSKYGGMSSFDFDELTRLVISAHDNCVRVEVCQGPPRGVKIRLWPRFTREGSTTQRHPEIEEAVLKFRGSR